MSLTDTIYHLGMLVGAHEKRTGVEGGVLFLGQEEYQAVQQWKKVLEEEGVAVSYVGKPSDSTFGNCSIILVDKQTHASLVSMND